MFSLANGLYRDGRLEGDGEVKPTILVEVTKNSVSVEVGQIRDLSSAFKLFRR